MWGEMWGGSLEGTNSLRSRCWVKDRGGAAKAIILLACLTASCAAVRDREIIREL